MDDEKEPDNLCPMTATKAIENLSEDNIKGVELGTPLGRTGSMDIVCTMHCSLLKILSMKVEAPSAPNL